jgi:hypothetical protein
VQLPCPDCSDLIGDGFLVQELRLDVKTEFLDPIPDLIAIEAQQLRGLALVSMTALEGLHQELALNLLHVHPFRWQAELRRHCGRAREVEIIGFDPLVSGEQHRPFDRVAQLTDVPWL